MKELRGKTAVVTGGASGIGYALCERFAAEGMRVVVADLDGGAAATAAERLAAAGVETLAVGVDVSDAGQVDRLAAQAVARFGGVEVLCNNAGVQMPGKTWEFTRQEWDWLLGVNLNGVINGIRAFVPRIIERGEPAHVVNTASSGGLVAYPGIAMYTTSKFAVVGLSESLAHDLAETGAPVGVSVLCPGPVVSRLRENSAALRPGGAAGRDVPSMTHVERMPAEAVAGMVVDAIRSRRFWIVTHGEYLELVRRRAEGIISTGEVVAPRPLGRGPR